MTRNTTGAATPVPLPSPKERRRLREAKSLSEQQVAAAVGVTRATVRSWETGRSSPRGRRRAAYVRLIGFATEPRSGQEQASADTRTKPAAPNTRPKPAAQQAAEPSTSPTDPQLSRASGQTPRTALRGAPPPTAEATGSSAVSPTEHGTGTRSPDPRPEPAASPGHPGTPPPEAAAPEPPKPARPDPAAPEPPRPAPPGPGTPAGLTADEAFDVLYTHTAPGLVRQTFLLTGRRNLAREAVERAFQQAWQRWPEVAKDRDPAGWVRAAAHEYAMSPWHRMRRAHRHPDAPPEEPGRRALLTALLELPPSYRRTLILYDGVGLDLPETAAETEASTPAAASRLLNARAAIAERLPELACSSSPGGQSALMHERLGGLALAETVPVPRAARAVRTGGEDKARLWTRAAGCLAVLLIGATGFTLHTAPTKYEQPLAPAERVGGVPPRAGPQKLTPQDLKLQKSLRGELAHGPERLVPQIP